MTATVNRELSQDQSESLLKILKTRFEKNRQRHNNIEWSERAGLIFLFDLPSLFM